MSDGTIIYDNNYVPPPSRVAAKLRPQDTCHESPATISRHIEHEKNLLPDMLRSTFNDTNTMIHFTRSINSFKTTIQKFKKLGSM